MAGCCDPIVVTDLDLKFGSDMNDFSDRVTEVGRWRRIKKELYLHMAESTAWLHIAEAKGNELTECDLAVTDIKVGDNPPVDSLEISWESRPCAI